MRSAALTAFCVLGMTLAAVSAHASNAKAEVVLEMERIERKIETTRWNLNTLEEKKRLQNELRMLRLLYDRIVDYEAELMAFPCAGAVIDGEGGPPESTEGSDIAGLLSQQAITAAQLGAGAGARGSPPPQMGGGGGDGLPALPGSGGGGGGYAFIHAITDVEVRLLAGLVLIEDRLAHDDWHLNNAQEKQTLLDERENLRGALRRLRNSRC